MNMTVGVHEVSQFDWLEYSVFGGMLCLSALIGVYFGFVDGGQDTVVGYMLGGKNMELLPVSASIVCTFISGVTLLGIPTDVYTHGIQYLASIFSFALAGLFTAYVMLPVFCKLEMVSLYQYLEMRFDSTVRQVVSFIYTIYLLLFLPVVIYGPALALNQVSGLSVHIVTISVSVVCIFYTTIGGLKAVVWTDTIQGVLMIISVLLVAVVGTIKVGGWDAVMEASSQGERLEMFDLDVDPRRNTLWSVSLGLTALFVSVTATNPSFVQRCIALSTIKKASAVLLWVLGALFFVIMSAYLGLVSYTKYQGCDPLRSGAINRPDQLLPLFIVEEISSVKGLPGVFIAGIVSAALSTMSAGMNTVAGTIYSDFIEPYIGGTTEKKASLYMKITSLVFGAVTVVLVLLVEKLGAILELAYSFIGISTGATLGVFLLGVFFPQATSKGANIGAVCSLGIMAWILIGSNAAISAGDIVHEKLVTSIADCNFTITALNSTLTATSLGKAFPLFEISVYYYSPMGAAVVVGVGLLASYATGPNKAGQVKRELLSPLIHRWLPAYTPVSTREVQLNDLKQEC